MSKKRTAAEQNGIVWEEPPLSRATGGRRRSEWPARLAPIMERPGEWARVKQGKKNTIAVAGTRLRNGSTPIRPEEWEFTVRRLADGETYGLYARYLGDSDA